MVDREDWSHAFYVGKLCEKLGYSLEESFSYYAQAIVLNPSAVDPFYRMHASRLKLLCKCGKQDEEVLKVCYMCLLYFLLKACMHFILSFVKLVGMLICALEIGMNLLS